jgi:hypothetical protein
MIKPALLLVFVLSTGATAQIYQWVDQDGQVHFGDSANKPDHAQKAAIGAVNTADTPPPAATGQAIDNTAAKAPPSPVMTASTWAVDHCSIRVRILYTERPFIPCVPTDEVRVYLCNTEVPRRFSNYFGRRYRYQDRESECGPEVYEGEILYLKK